MGGWHLNIILLSLLVSCLIGPKEASAATTASPDTTALDPTTLDLASLETSQPAATTDQPATQPQTTDLQTTLDSATTDATQDLSTLPQSTADPTTVGDGTTAEPPTTEKEDITTGEAATTPAGQETTAADQTTLGGITSDKTGSTDSDQITAESTVATDLTSLEPEPTTDIDTNTSDMPTCPSGYFGPTCEFRCLCNNLTEACDSRSGYCKTGCPPGQQGPGCNMPTPGGDTPVVVMLGVLLTMALILALVLLAMILRMKRKQRYASSAENHAYEFPEMPAARYDGIERIRETDIQVHTDPLGEGRFGDILPGKIQRGKGRIDVAFKTLKDGATEAEKSGLMAQLHLYSQLEPHNNVIQFYGLCSVGDQIYAAFEYASKGNLRNFLRQSSMPESDTLSVTAITRNESLLINFCLEVAQGMQYLASKKIVHRELMARHILVAKNNICKVSGLNPTLRNEKNYPVRWMAPESLNEGTFSQESDVWSFGVLMWEVMSLGGQPYPDIPTKDIASLISGVYRMSPPEDCSPVVYNVMSKCWEEEPATRPTFTDLINDLNVAMMSAVDDASIIIEEDDMLD